LERSSSLEEFLSTPNCEDLASILMAQGGLTRLAIVRLKNNGVPVAPLLSRAGLTEVVADPEGRLSVRSQITLLDEAAKALKDDWLGFTLARDFDPGNSGCCTICCPCQDFVAAGVRS
jgi:Arabinose-binding domain of AraC transcription regulator, N-term